MEGDKRSVELNDTVDEVSDKKASSGTGSIASSGRWGTFSRVSKFGKRDTLLPPGGDERGSVRKTKHSKSKATREQPTGLQDNRNVQEVWFVRSDRVKEPQCVAG
eukprot:GHVS01086337.1.p2 GENE.GHVS01086337.1~~GHVS01086337.1.p2  ORF type:complete len:105 (+),score=13.39 GHVS01086337.1:122-436(+)